MKKLMTLMLGMTLMFGTVAVVFGQDAPKKEEGKKAGKKKGGKKKTGDDTKKDAGKSPRVYSFVAGSRVARVSLRGNPVPLYSPPQVIP